MAVAARVRNSRVVQTRSAVAERRRQYQSRAVTEKRRVRRPRPTAHIVVSCFLALAFAFFYVSTYGTLCATSHSLSELQKQLRAEQILNERLKVELERKLSPRGVDDAALAIGMVYTAEYDYLRDTRSVASTPPDR